MSDSAGESALGRLPVLTIGGCIALVLATAAVLVFPGLRAFVVPPPAVVGGYSVGDQIDLPPSLYSSARTLVLFAESSCSACQRSKPLLARLVSEVSTVPNTESLLVVDADERFRLADDAYAREIGIEPQRVHRTALRSLRLKVVPAVVVVDRSGQVLMSITGAVDPSRGDDVVRTVREQMALTDEARAR